MRWGRSDAVASEEGSQQPSRHTRLDIQGLRAVAVLLVMAYHARLPVPGGFIGVDIFFVISGFVITAMLMREHDATGRIALRAFYLRRFRRLMPALAVVVAVTVLLSAALLSPYDMTQVAVQTGLGAMFFVANFVIAYANGDYFSPSAESNPLLNTWSLSVEEQFYFFFPVFLIAGWYLARTYGRRVLLAMVVIASAASFCIMLLPPISSSNLNFYSPATRMWEFAVGALLALTWDRVQHIRSLTAALLGFLGSLLLVASALSFQNVETWPSAWTLIPVVGTLLLLAAGDSTNAPVQRVLTSRPMVAIGDYSYSLYLWHWPVMVICVTIWPEFWWVAPIAVVASALPAIASYRWVEQPFRLGAWASRKGDIRLVVLTLLVPTLAAVAVGVGASRILVPGFASDTTTLRGDISRAAFVESMADNLYPCANLAIREMSPTSGGVVRCFQSQSSGPVTAAIIGDSHADALLPGFAEAVPGRNIAAYFQTQNVTLSNPSYTATLDIVAADPAIDVVILSKFWQMRGIDEDEIRQTLEMLVESGKEVFLVADTPVFPFGPFTCKHGRAPIWPDRVCQVDDVDAVRTLNATADTLERLSAPFGTAVHVLTPHAAMCDAHTCSMEQDGIVLYRDHDHFNADGSRWIVDALLSSSPALRAALASPLGGGSRG